MSTVFDVDATGDPFEEDGVRLVRSPSGATGSCPECGTVYDLHGVDLEDQVPPFGDGCPACAPGSEPS